MRPIRRPDETPEAYAARLMRWYEQRYSRLAFVTVVLGWACIYFVVTWLLRLAGA